MIQRREHLRFALEARKTIGIARKCVRQDFDRDIAPEPRIARAVDVAHPAAADQRDDLVSPESGSTRQRHAAI